MSQQTRNNTTSILKNYDRRDGTDNLGGEFEIKITALLALRCISLEDTENIWIGSNVAHIGDFDDIVLYRQTTDGRRLFYMLQLKHQNKPSDITVREFLNEKIKEKNFLLSKYSKTLKAKLNSQTANEQDIIQCLREVDDMFFIMFTNKGVDTDQCDFLDMCNDRTLDFLCTSTSTDNRFKFNGSKFGLSENIKLFSNQVHINGAINLIKNQINHLLGPSFKLPSGTSEIVKKFVEFITAWAKGNEIENIRRYFTLTKFDIICKLTDILLCDYKYNLLKIKSKCSSSSEDSLHNCQKYIIWNQITSDKNITIVDSDDVVVQFLLHYVATEVGMYHKLDKRWGEELSKESLSRIHEKYEDIEMSLLKMNGNREKITTLDLYTSLWFTNKIPLLLKVKDVQDYENIVNILSLSNFSLRAIIIKKKDLKLDTKVVADTKYFNTLNDLNDDDRSTILNQPIKLQNRPNHTLGELINPDKSMDKLVTCKDVIQILQAKFNVGNIYEPLADFHIERTLSRVFLKPDVFNKVNNEIFLLNYVRSLEESSFPENVIVVESSKQLEDVIFLENVVHEVIMHDDGNLEWKRSFGPTKNILMYVVERKEKIKQGKVKGTDGISLKDKEEYLLNGTHILTAAPGMGKSTYADFISANAPTYMWVIKIVLNKYQKYYKNIQNHSATDYLNFFADKLLQNCDNIELDQAIFQKFVYNLQILVILDGFDEIVICHENEVTKIAKCLHNEGFPLWITTRPNKKCELEEKFGTIALTLNPLTPQDQKVLLTSYFNQTCIGDNLNQYLFSNFIEMFVTKLLKVVRCNFLLSREFLGIPLHVKLLTEVFSADCVTSFQTGDIILNNTFTLVDLYESFIKKKVDILCEKFGDDAVTSRICIEKYQKLFALKYLNYSNFLEHFNINDQLNEYYNGRECNLHFLQREGLVVVDQKLDGRKWYYNINFTHRTFAEFLAAQWFAENISNSDNGTKYLLKNLIFERRDNLVYNMLNLMLAKGCPLHIAVLTGNIEEAKRILQTDSTHANKLDKGGRTILHILAIKSYAYPHLAKSALVSNLIQNIDVNLANNKDYVCQFTAIDYIFFSDAGKFHHYMLANQMCEKFPNLKLAHSRFTKEHVLNQCLKYGMKHLFRLGLEYYVSRNLLLSFIDKNTTISSYSIFPETSSKYQNTLKYFTNDFGVTTISELFQFKAKSVHSLIDHYYYDLHIACSLGTIENVKHLLAKNVEINSLCHGLTPLHCAAHHNRFEIVKLLVDEGVNIDQGDEYGRTALHFASSGYTANELLLRGGDINKSDIHGETPLFASIKHGRADSAKLLLLKNANLPNRSLHCAVEYKCPDIIPELLAKGACINEQDKEGYTPLNLALFKGNFEIARLLLFSDANVNLTNNAGFSPLYYAAFSSCTDILPELIAKGACIDQQDKDGATLLNLAFMNRYLHTASLLLSNGANVNLDDNSGSSCLHCAAYFDCTDIIPQLIAKGACINKETKHGNTPLHLAVNKVLISTVECLLNNGANINHPNKLGRSPLHTAVIEKFTNTYRTSLANRIVVVRLLLDRRADINVQDEEGNTPLHYACRNDYANLVRPTAKFSRYLEFHHAAKLLLLERNADSNIKNKLGKTASEWAMLPPR